MSTTKRQAQPKSRLWDWLTSIRLTVYLLLILAAVAILGAVLPQGQPAEFYLDRFGETWGGVVWRGGLANIYFSIWFLAPVNLLALNILSCLINGLPRAWRRSFTPLSAEQPSNCRAGRAQMAWDNGPAGGGGRYLAPGIGPPPAPELAGKRGLLL